MSFFQDIAKDKNFTDIIIGFAGAVLMILTIWLRKIAPKILAEKQKKIIKYDHNNLIKAIANVYDKGLQIGAMRGHVIYYENHGPQKLSVMFETKGKPCGDCISKCRFFDPIEGIRRISKDYSDKRPLHEFWLINVVNKTLSLDGDVNTVTYQDAINDHEQREIWDHTGTGLVKECFVKTKGDHEFITICFEFCKRFTEVDHIDIEIKNLAHRLKKLL